METNKEVLHLVLKRKWYEMILNGGKKEEYREITPYWINRLCECFDDGIDIPSSYYIDPKPYKYVTFHLGYTSITMTFEIEKIDCNYGNIHWGAKLGKVYFVIRLGRFIRQSA